MGRKLAAACNANPVIVLNYSRKFAYLVSQLNEVSDGDGTLLAAPPPFGFSSGEFSALKANT
ncbi:MAG TPA: hypothetical protein VMI54_14250 [Polyangiaceae bacterium]|nr:hypothetical protein [Polyangiaceae bacterium]